MQVLIRAACAALFLSLAAGGAFASRNVAPCPSTHWCRDVATLKDAVYVYAPYGTFHFHGGRYARDGIGAAFFNRPGLIAFDGGTAAVMTTFHSHAARAAVYVHIFRRTASGLYENAATRRLGVVRPMSLTLHGARLRVSALDSRGYETTTIYHLYHLADRELHAVATRHAQ